MSFSTEKSHLQREKANRGLPILRVFLIVLTIIFLMPTGTSEVFGDDTRRGRRQLLEQNARRLRALAMNQYAEEAKLRDQARKLRDRNKEIDQKDIPAEDKKITEAIQEMSEAEGEMDQTKYDAASKKKQAAEKKKAELKQEKIDNEKKAKALDKKADEYKARGDAYMKDADAQQAGADALAKGEGGGGGHKGGGGGEKGSPMMPPQQQKQEEKKDEKDDQPQAQQAEEPPKQSETPKEKTDDKKEQVVDLAKVMEEMREESKLKTDEQIAEERKRVDEQIQDILDKGEQKTAETLAAGGIDTNQSGEQTGEGATPIQIKNPIPKKQTMADKIQSGSFIGAAMGGSAPRSGRPSGFLNKGHAMKKQEGSAYGRSRGVSAQGSYEQLRADGGKGKGKSSTMSSADARKLLDSIMNGGVRSAGVFSASPGSYRGFVQPPRELLLALEKSRGFIGGSTNKHRNRIPKRKKTNKRRLR